MAGETQGINRVNDHSSWYTSITTNPTVEKVETFFISIKDKLVSALASFTASIISFYNTYSPKIKEFSNNHKLPIVFTIAAIALAYFYPLSALVFGTIGFATNRMLPVEDDEKIVNVSNCALTAVGALALAMPACSLSALAVVAGSIGIGRTVHNIYSHIFNR